MHGVPNLRRGVLWDGGPFLYDDAWKVLFGYQDWVFIQVSLAVNKIERPVQSLGIPKKKVVHQDRQENRSQS